LIETTVGIGYLEEEVVRKRF